MCTLRARVCVWECARDQVASKRGGSERVKGGVSKMDVTVREEEEEEMEVKVVEEEGGRAMFTRGRKRKGSREIYRVCRT